MASPGRQRLPSRLTKNAQTEEKAVWCICFRLPFGSFERPWAAVSVGRFYWRDTLFIDGENLGWR